MTFNELKMKLTVFQTPVKTQRLVEVQILQVQWRKNESWHTNIQAFNVMNVFAPCRNKYQSLQSVDNHMEPLYLPMAVFCLLFLLFEWELGSAEIINTAPCLLWSILLILSRECTSPLCINLPAVWGRKRILVLPEVHHVLFLGRFYNDVLFSC